MKNFSLTTQSRMNTYTPSIFNANIAFKPTCTKQFVDGVQVKPLRSNIFISHNYNNSTAENPWFIDIVDSEGDHLARNTIGSERKQVKYDYTPYKYECKDYVIEKMNVLGYTEDECVLIVNHLKDGKVYAQEHLLNGFLLTSIDYRTPTPTIVNKEPNTETYHPHD